MCMLIVCKDRNNIYICRRFSLKDCLYDKDFTEMHFKITYSHMAK